MTALYEESDASGGEDNRTCQLTDAPLNAKDDEDSPRGECQRHSLSPLASRYLPLHFARNETTSRRIRRRQRSACGDTGSCVRYLAGDVVGAGRCVLPGECDSRRADSLDMAYSPRKRRVLRVVKFVDRE